MIRKLIFLPLIFLFISCSVTKRVHRSGYHIQWHKTERTQSPKKQTSAVKVDEEAKTNTSDQEITARFETVNSIDSTEVKLNQQEEIAAIIPTKPTTKKRLPRLLSHLKKSDFASIVKTKNTTAKASSQTSSRPIFWRMSAKSLKTLGSLLIFLGVLILLGSFLNAAGAFTGGGSGAWANFFLDLVEISNWFWLLVFILLIVLLLYVSVMLVRYAFGGTIIGLIIGVSLLVLGIFFHNLGKNREIEP